MSLSVVGVDSLFKWQAVHGTNIKVLSSVCVISRALLIFADMLVIIVTWRNLHKTRSRATVLTTPISHILLRDGGHKSCFIVQLPL